MKPAHSRLLVVSLLFIGWLGYLGWLAATRPWISKDQPLVVSVPQIQASQLDVIAQLPAPPQRGDAPDLEGVEVTVEEVLFGKGVSEGQKIRVLHLDDCRPTPRYGDKSPPPLDWSGPGSWLLALREAKQFPGKQVYEMVPILASPGYGGGPPRVYPANAETRAQYGRIEKPRLEKP
jgi:hypothetical protein